jgi:hypothetical protein
MLSSKSKTNSLGSHLIFFDSFWNMVQFHGWWDKHFLRLHIWTMVLYQETFSGKEGPTILMIFGSNAHYTFSMPTIFLLTAHHSWSQLESMQLVLTSLRLIGKTVMIHQTRVLLLLCCGALAMTCDNSFVLSFTDVDIIRCLISSLWLFPFMWLFKADSPMYTTNINWFQANLALCTAWRV